MLMIIGGNRSSCIHPGTHVLEGIDVSKSVGDRVDVVDFGDRQTVLKFIESARTWRDTACPSNRTLIVEYAYFALSGRAALTRYCQDVTTFLLAYRQFGYENVILLTRHVKLIRKRVRDVADVMFDFSV